MQHLQQPSANDAINFECVKKAIGGVEYIYPVMVYIAVGSANNALQQFPPFLQELIAINKTMRLIIVSIDSLHEFPPLAFTNINNLGKRVEIFVYKCNVCVISDKHREKNECIHPNKDVHIYSQLHDMNEYTLSVGGSLLFNMYSGANISLLAETFDSEYINNLDQIVYGIGGRINHGCFFDMHTDLAYFATRIDNVTILHSSEGVIKRPLIKMFNYYKHILNKTIGSDAERRDISSYPRPSLKYINAQINNIVVSLWDDFKNTHLFMLRQIYNKLHSPVCMASLEEINLYGGNLPLEELNEYNKLVKEKQYDLLYSLVYSKCEEVIDTILKIKKKDLDGSNLMSFIVGIDNPYEWGAYIHKHFLVDS